MTLTRIGAHLRHGALPIAAVLSLALVAALACTSDPDDTPSTSGATDVAMAAGADAMRLSGSADGASQGIWVTGAGRVSVTPDMATLRLGVQADADTVSDAMSDAAQSMQALIDALTDAGIDEDDIQTLNFRVSPRYEWNDRLRRNEMVGFSVSNTVSATVRDLDSVAEVIDAAVRAGGDHSRVDGLSFGVEDRADAEREARQLAVNAALEQAAQLASAAGVALGAPFYMAESGAAPVAEGQPELLSRAVAFDTAVSTPILSGEQDIIIYVRVGYEIG